MCPLLTLNRMEFFQLAISKELPIGDEGYEKIGRIATALAVRRIKAEWYLLAFLRQQKA